ncbi:MAG: dUTP diphosphatase [Nocardioidaceae bacterium]|nr:dUTP diphosphatase [Nocardioidaceae bacterium]
MVEVFVTRLDTGVPLPAYAHPGDAGADLVSTVDVRLAPGERALVPTGIAVALPVGYAAFVHPRSGLAARCGLSIVNTPGTIDAGYRGEISVLLVNLDPNIPITLHRGDRIAQLVVQAVEHADFSVVHALPDSARGAGGYGSTGGVGRPRVTETAGAGSTHDDDQEAPA